MSYTADINDDTVFVALKAFIVDTLGAAVNADSVVRAPVNRVPTPNPDPFIVMSPILKEKIAWPSTAVTDPTPQPQSEGITMPTRYQIQVDIYGVSAGDLTQLLFVVLSSANAFDFFNALTPAGVYPLYADTPHQMPFVDGEAQYEERWVLDVSLQFNPTLTTTVQTASTVAVGVINVEAAYN